MCDISSCSSLISCYASALVDTIGWKVELVFIPENVQIWYLCKYLKHYFQTET